jgi:23S rRNA (adenine2503-C2)-methyltransferase
VLTQSCSEDGTRKFLLEFGAGQQAETVYIPEPTRGTLCVSSQVGCTLSCSFCHTGTQPVMRNLTAGDIVSQVIQAKRMLNDFPTLDDLTTRNKQIHERRREARRRHAAMFNKLLQADSAEPPRVEEEGAEPTHHVQGEPEEEKGGEPQRSVTNIVFMGQGEPFYNYRNVRQAIAVLSDSAGLGIGQGRITVSTSGVVPNIYRLAEDTKVNLAISLHATNNELRDELVPINKQYPLDELLNACRFFLSMKRKRIMFEYVMLKEVNDQAKHALELVNLIGSLPNSLVNLIPFNPWPGTKYACSSDDQILAFHKILIDHQIAATIRWPRGRDIMAACGQLKTHHDRVTRIEARGA